MGTKKGNSGPPDLEELWLNFNKKLNNIFGSKRPNNGQSGGEEGPGNGNFKRYMGGMGAGLFAGLIFLLWLASGFYIVNEGQRGLILRFGQYTQTTQAGLRWHFPYPIETVENVNVSQVRTVEIGYRNNVKSKVLKESLMLTDDENIIDIQFAVQYILKIQKNFYLITVIQKKLFCKRRKHRFVKLLGKVKWILCSTKDESRWQRKQRN